MSQNIPLVDLGAQHRQVADEVAAGWADILARTAFVGGPAVAAFEAEYAQYIGVEHCIGVGNGTDAIEFALRALDIGAGDEVIVQANTFIASVEAIARAGATPVLVDCVEDTALIDTDKVADAVTPRTRAILPVHLYGQAAEIEQLQANLPESIAIVEDAAQSQGARRKDAAAGALGRIAATSFYPGKNLGAYGDAGGVLTNDTELATRVRLLRDHGSPRKYEHTVLGFNSRLDALQAVVLSAKLKRLDGWNDARRRAADRYDALLKDVEGVVPPVVAPGNEPVWHLYVVRVAERDRVLAQLQADGIGASIHYPTPVHLTGAFADLGHKAGDFPITERITSEIISLPLFAEITEAQQQRVVESLVAAVQG
ncbi:DegT/DnrJ/EryC1/StrS family aminotransferase [Pseudonocardia sp. TRM90224]|uniref:DegT/DnrJ/EryC1/StrS family aminotransferase n=1 Tax=Pseudonocardia sp. TRM90224 TaxID=2812678 RepID=UPI001E4C4AC9|nr:DegT/DnrJ/EryC1/StrS family aminotransferase [Pseudonocardia sp. TRM90224]